MKLKSYLISVIRIERLHMEAREKFQIMFSKMLSQSLFFIINNCTALFMMMIIMHSLTINNIKLTRFYFFITV